MPDQAETEPANSDEPLRSTASPKLQVDVWSDIACPWCWIGKHKLETALSGFAHTDEVIVVWHAFELDPSAAATQDNPYLPYAERLARKYGCSTEEGQAMIDRMTRAGAENGVRMRFDRIRPVNTFDAHRLLHLAYENGLQNCLKELLFKAYLEKGEAIDERNTLLRAADAAGIDAAQAEAVLSGDAYKVQVRKDEAKATALGITGVPFFLFGKQRGVSGAQAAEVLLDLLNQTWDEQRPKPETVKQGASCGSNGCL